MEQLHAAVLSTLATFGAAQDAALQEMRIESFLAADEATHAPLTAARYSRSSELH
jgi:hypothetical protein